MTWGGGDPPVLADPYQWRYLEDHPMTCMWLITMVDKSAKDRIVPLIHGLTGL